MLFLLFFILLSFNTFRPQPPLIFFLPSPTSCPLSPRFHCFSIYLQKTAALPVISTKHCITGYNKTKGQQIYPYLPLWPLVILINNFLLVSSLGLSSHNTTLKEFRIGLLLDSEDIHIHIHAHIQKTIHMQLKGLLLYLIYIQ